MIASRELTKNQLRQLEEELLSERARLERSLEIQNPQDAPTTAFGGVVPLVPTSEQGGVAQALASRAHARYAAILDALTRLAAGAYGICAGCSGRIPFGRLLVMPEATRCVACGPRL